MTFNAGQMKKWPKEDRLELKPSEQTHTPRSTNETTYTSAISGTAGVDTKVRVRTGHDLLALRSWPLSP